VSAGVSATARAHANIALAKYWGKADVALNLPAVPSLSLTLAALSTLTRVELDPELTADQFVLDGAPAKDRPLARVTSLLDNVREPGALRARVTSTNDFPTAAGLASSASGFAALALAASAAYGTRHSAEALSSIARRASASAARSLFGGFVALEAAKDSAERVLEGAQFPVKMLIAVTRSGPKEVDSTAGMKHTLATSPYYPAWVEHAPSLYAEVRRAVLAKDLELLGAAMEQSALMMHASMFAARPALVYFTPATLAAVATVRALRTRGTLAFYTMDAGPHVKVLTSPSDAPAVERALSETPGVLRVLASDAGPDATLVSEDGR
jgi:diphosphomevalonate decarboxylase